MFKMKMKVVQRDDIVNNLVNKNNKTKIVDVFMNDATQIIQNFNEAFQRDIENSDIEKFVDKYAIDSPFHEIIHTKINTRRNMIRSTAKTKWDLIDLDTFSPKYMIALDKILEHHKNEETLLSATDDDGDKIKEWNAVDEEWKNKAREMVNNENKVDIVLPDGFYNTIKRSYAIQGLKKRMPWIAASKTTAKTVSDRFKKGRRKESLRTTMVQEQTVVEEVEPEPPSWNEMEKMRNKCIDWLIKNGMLEESENVAE